MVSKNGLLPFFEKNIEFAVFSGARFNYAER